MLTQCLKASAGPDSECGFDRLGCLQHSSGGWDCLGRCVRLLFMRCLRKCFDSSVLICLTSAALLKLLMICVRDIFMKHPHQCILMMFYDSSSSLLPSYHL